jgi:hypothetical protein
MPSEKKEKEEVQAVIEYVYPPDFEEAYASGARILVTSPHHVKMNFFWDKLQDDILEENVVNVGGEQRIKTTKKTQNGGRRRLKREFVASVTLGLPAFGSLVKALNDVAKREKLGDVQSE